LAAEESHHAQHVQPVVRIQGEIEEAHAGQPALRDEEDIDDGAGDGEGILGQHPRQGSLVTSQVGHVAKNNNRPAASHQVKESHGSIHRRVGGNSLLKHQLLAAK